MLKEKAHQQAEMSEMTAFSLKSLCICEGGKSGGGLGENGKLPKSAQLYRFEEKKRDRTRQEGDCK